MAVESKKWVKASRRTNIGTKGGFHAYIDSETIRQSLKNTMIKITDELEINRYPLEGTKNIGQILIKIRRKKL